MEALKQKGMKPNSQTGSFINMLMSNNSTVPEVGKGATVLLWTYRHAYEVIEVSEDKKRVVVQKYNAKRIDSNGMSDSQQYEYKELLPNKRVIVWRRGAWRWEKECIEYVRPDVERKDEHYDENARLKLIDGVTIKVKHYSKVNIIWGVKDEYYDYSF